MEQVVILGGGPAGMTAAIYAARANLEPLCLIGESDEKKALFPGGQLMITTEVENFPGFPQGIQGPEMMLSFRRQAEKFGARVLEKFATRLELQKRPFEVHYDGQAVQTRSIIIATGASARWLGLPSEAALRGHGVSACATCDAFFYKGQDVAVVGGGDSALEEALFLTKFASKVYIIHRRDELRGSKVMRARAQQNPKIEFVWNSVIEEVLGVAEQKMSGVRLKNVLTGGFSTLNVTGLFIAIGHTPNSQLVEGMVEMTENGFIKVKHPTTYTSVAGVFACGDVIDPRYKQAITAAGTGCCAAIDVERWLGEQEASVEEVDSGLLERLVEESPKV